MTRINRTITLVAVVFLATCESSPLAGKWQGRRGTEILLTLTISEEHGRLSGTYLIMWGEEPSEVSGSLGGSYLHPAVVVELTVQVADGMAMCRYNAELINPDVLSGEIVCRLPDREFASGALAMHRE